MKLNLSIMALVGLLAYALTLYMDTRTPNAPHISVPPDSAIHILPEETPAQAFTFTDANNKTYDLSDFKGKTIILNFWASWCAPCIKEFPILIEAAQNAPDDIVLIALSSDIDEASMHKFIAKLKLPKGKASKNIHIAFDKNQAVTQGLYQTFKLPETYIIDKAQNTRAKIIGADWTGEELQLYLDLLLGST